MFENGGPGVGVGDGVGVGAAGFPGRGDGGAGEADGSTASAAGDASNERTPQNEPASSVRSNNSKTLLVEI
jgi:hypothetical protein